MPCLSALFCLAFNLAFLVSIVAVVDDHDCVVNFNVTEENKDQYEELMNNFAKENNLLLTVLEGYYVKHYNSPKTNPDQWSSYIAPGQLDGQNYFTTAAWNRKRPWVHFIGSISLVWVFVQGRSSSSPGRIRTYFDWSKSFVEHDGENIVAIKQDGTAYYVFVDDRSINIIAKIDDYKPKCVPRNGEHCLYDPYTEKAESRETAIVNAYCNFYVAKRNGKFYIGDGGKEVCLRREADPRVADLYPDYALVYLSVKPHNLSSCGQTGILKGPLRPLALPIGPASPESDPSIPNDDPPKKSDSASSTALSLKPFVSLVLCGFGRIFLKTMIF